MLAAYGSSGGGGSGAGYWLVVVIIAVLVIAVLWWAYRRMRTRGGRSATSNGTWSDTSGVTGGEDDRGHRAPTRPPTGSSPP